MHPDCYTLSLPYPTEKPRAQNLRLARRIFPMYTGQGGELNAISDYLYASLRLEEAHPELSTIFDELARVEMHHFRLLGALIRDLGADPVIRTCLRTDSPSISPQALHPMFEQFRHDELSAADNYRYLCTQTNDDAVRALLDRIIQDEEQHAALFEQLLRR